MGPWINPLKLPKGGRSPHSTLWVTTGNISASEPLTSIQDSTLITTSSGNVFAKDATDWKWWHVSVPTVLRQLYADGY